MSFIKSISTYTISNIINSGISFFMLPILTVYLTKEDYGYVSLISIYIAFCLPFISLSSNGAIQKSYFKKTKEELRTYIKSGLQLNIFLFLVAFFLISATNFFFNEWINIPTYWILVVPIIGLGKAIENIVVALFQMQDKPIQYAYYRIGFSVFNVLLALFFIVYLGMDWRGRVIGWFITYLLSAFIGLIILKRKNLIGHKVSDEDRKDIFKFGFPLFFHAVAGTVLTLSDRLFIANMVNIQEVGLYSVGYQIAMVLGIITDSFILAYTPALYKGLKENTPKSRINIIRISYLLLIVLVAVITIIYFLLPYIYKYFIGNEFYESIHYVIIILISYLFIAMYKVVVGPIFYYSKTYLLGYLAFVNVTLNLGLNYFMIGEYGALGAAYATVISNFVFFILTAIISYKVKKMPWFSFSLIFNIK